MAEQTTSFSTSGEDAITRVLDVKRDNATNNMDQIEFDEFYEIKRTAEEIIKGDYKSIALQFPDELLHDSVPIYRRLKPLIGIGRELYVLADTSYGSCCVDEVAAQHVDADAMVHYGHACMSKPSRLPIIYVFGKKDINVDRCIDLLVEALQQNNTSTSTRRTAMFRHDVAYTHHAEIITNRLQKALDALEITLLYEPIFTSASPPLEEITGPTQLPKIHPSYEIIFYVGGESLGLTNLLITNSSCDVFSFDPTTDSARLESARTNKLLMRRYAVVQKARDADVFGILVGTLGVASYLPVMRHLRALLAKHRKKTYTITVGKLNPAKLANFLEIECFVLVACPENSLIEAKDFLRPIVTPFELEISLQSEQSWTGKYVLDFEKILAGNPPQESTGEDRDPNQDPDQPVFSLMTGKYRHAKRYGGMTEQEEEASSAVILRNSDNAVAQLKDSAAGLFLQERTYQGLERSSGEDAPSILEQGRSGIARGYQDDHPPFS